MLPVTHGSLLDFPADPGACMEQLQQTHGNLASLKDGSQQIVFVFGPEWNQRVLTDTQTFHSRFFSIRGPRRSAQRRLTCGLLSMNGEEHREHRRIVMQPFQRRAISGYQEATHRLTLDLLNEWKPGQVRDMHQEMTQFMLRVTSAILFGLDVPELACEVGEMLHSWVELNHVVGMGAILSDTAFTERYDELLSLAEQLELKVRELINFRRQAGAGGQDVLSLLIQAHDEHQAIDEDELIGHVALLFGAAHMTTAHTLAWTLFLLAQHPSVMREVDAEIHEQMAGELPTMEEAARMPLIERVLKESMRVLPASGYSQRLCDTSVTLGPLNLRRGTPVVFSQYITHRMPELFPEPKNFQPDRWLEISPSPYAFLPFGAGPRMCLGAALSMVILKTVVPAMFRRFRLTMVPGARVDGRIVSTMLGPTSPVPMLISRADGCFEAMPVTGTIQQMLNLPEMPAAGTGLRRAA
ncbi:MAG: cytochrome P450 [Planctomycetaceae bacterium]|nr:cytochrome P450 [Planctomycetaceae bacterium]